MLHFIPLLLARQMLAPVPALAFGHPFI